jgi:uncharacterized pyridoxamine 5'-phosphate oxidase family protein
MKFRKKPVIIDAIQWTGKNTNDVLHFCNKNTTLAILGENKDFIMIATLEGRIQANINDWIIKGIKEEYYPIKPDIFESTYEQVT